MQVRVSAACKWPGAPQSQRPGFDAFVAAVKRGQSGRGQGWSHSPTGGWHQRLGCVRCCMLMSRSQQPASLSVSDGTPQKTRTIRLLRLLLVPTGLPRPPSSCRAALCPLPGGVNLPPNSGPKLPKVVSFNPSASTQPSLQHGQLCGWSHVRQWGGQGPATGCCVTPNFEDAHVPATKRYVGSVAVSACGSHKAGVLLSGMSGLTPSMQASPPCACNQCDHGSGRGSRPTHSPSMRSATPAIPLAFSPRLQASCHRH